MLGKLGMLGRVSLCLLGGLLVYGLWGVSFPPRFYSEYFCDPKLVDPFFDPKIEDRKIQKENPVSDFSFATKLTWYRPLPLRT
jgi:hypothetical protein